TRRRAFCSSRSALPDDLDRPRDAGKRQSERLRLDLRALARGQATPRADPNRVGRASPRAANLAAEEERTRPDARRPELLPAIGARQEQLALLAAEEQEVRVPARQQARRPDGLDRLACGFLVGREQPLVAE